MLPATTATRGRIRVLHVDDDPGFANLVSDSLESEDEWLTVRTETSPSAGLDRLDDAAVDCVVSGYQMPEMDGFAFFERLREDQADLPFILFTGKGSEEIASEALTAGVSDYLQKESGPDQFAVQANRIFDPGYTTGEDGTGLGLKIVRDVVSAHGWTVTATGSDDGGLRFDVTGVDVVASNPAGE